MLVPSRWVVLEIEYNGEKIHKLFSSIDSGWRLNSGITDVVEVEDVFIITGYSSTQYYCNKYSYGIRETYDLLILDKILNVESDIITLLSYDKALEILNSYKKETKDEK